MVIIQRDLTFHPFSIIINHLKAKGPKSPHASHHHEHYCLPSIDYCKTQTRITRISYIAFTPLGPKYYLLDSSLRSNSNPRGSYNFQMGPKEKPFCQQLNCLRGPISLATREVKSLCARNQTPIKAGPTLQCLRVKKTSLHFQKV
jgi:hypothetical protein